MLQLVIPAYNEAGRLPATLAALRETVAVLAAEGARALPGAVPVPVEVIVVDNASTDDTAAVARAADGPDLRVRVVTCAERGKGAAVRAGLLATTAAHVGFMDADGATDLGALAPAWRLLQRDADVVLGSRALHSSVTQARHSRLRDGGARLYRRLAGHVVPGVADTQCGFKLLRGDLARAVAADLRTAGFAFDVELLARARAAGGRLLEIPVVWHDVPGSTFDPVRHGWASFRDLGRLAWQLRDLPVVPAPALAPVPVPGAAPGLRLVSSEEAA